jgi:hypothetical protein
MTEARGVIRHEWWRQSLYRRVSMEWASGFARWLEDQGWTVGKITRVPGLPDAVHVPAIRPLPERSA